jgi:hypothetical protein
MPKHYLFLLNNLIIFQWGYSNRMASGKLIFEVNFTSRYLTFFLCLWGKVALTWHFHIYNVDGEFPLLALSRSRIYKFITNSSTWRENPRMVRRSKFSWRLGGPFPAAAGVPHVTAEVLAAARAISLLRAENTSKFHRSDLLADK